MFTFTLVKGRKQVICTYLMDTRSITLSTTPLSISTNSTPGLAFSLDRRGSLTCDVSSHRVPGPPPFLVKVDVVVPSVRRQRGHPRVTRTHCRVGRGKVRERVEGIEREIALFTFKFSYSRTECPWIIYTHLNCIPPPQWNRPRRSAFLETLSSRFYHHHSHSTKVVFRSRSHMFGFSVKSYTESGLVCSRGCVGFRYSSIDFRRRFILTFRF